MLALGVPSNLRPVLTGAPTLWLVANGIALAALVAAIGGWKRPGARLRAAVTAAVAAAAVAWVLAFLPSAQLPIGWVTVLHEGRTIRNVKQLYGATAHAGSGFHFMIDWMTGHDVTTLPAVVHANLLLALASAIVFASLAVAILGSWWAGLALAIAYAGNLNTQHAAVSETPAVLWSNYFLLGCVAAAVIGDRANAGSVQRWLALSSLALLAGLAALLRVELLLIAAPAVALGAAAQLGWEPALRRTAQSAWRGLRALMARRSTFLLVVVGLVALERLPWPAHWRWLIAGLQPFNLSFLVMPRVLGGFLPLGLVALFVLGTVHALRHWLAFFLLPITLFALFKVYLKAGHAAYFESFRYMTFLTPVALFLALFGFRELSDWARRLGWPAWWKRAAVAILVLACVDFPQQPGLKELFGRRQQLPGMTEPPRLVSALGAPLLAWNQQTEVRYLLDLVARHPSCVFLAKGTRAEADTVGGDGYLWAIFGGPVPRYREMAHSGESTQQVAARVAPNAACVLFYRGLDCNLVDGDGCRAETLGGAPIEGRVLENLPYSDIREYGAHRPEIRLEVYPVRRSAPASSSRR